MEDKFDAVLEYFGADVSDSEDYFENYRKNIVTKVAYLIGVPDEILENETKFVVSELDPLRKHKAATLIRSLCILRTQFFKNYISILFFCCKDEK